MRNHHKTLLRQRRVQFQMQLPDVQKSFDERGIFIDQVGVTGIRYPLSLPLRDGGRFSTVANLSLTVSLSHEEKGTHMSRFMQSLNVWAGKFSPEVVDDLLYDMKTILKAEEAQISMSFPIFLNRRAPVTGEAGLMDYDCEFSAMLNTNVSDKVVGIKANVATLCPCSKEIAERGAHNQRSSVHLQVRPIEGKFVWFEDLIELAERSASCALYPVLKRPDEKYVTEYAYDNPRFVEDVVRECFRLASEVYNGKALFDSIKWFFVSSTNKESIHNHNAYGKIEYGIRGPLLCGRGTSEAVNQSESSSIPLARKWESSRNSSRSVSTLQG